MPMNTFLMIAAIIGTVVTHSAQTQAQQSVSKPFGPGEKLKFVLKWGNIPAGEATLEVLPVETINGEDAYHFVVTAETNSFVDIFFRVRDKIDSYTDLDVTRSLLYKSKQREGSYKRDILVDFDWTKQQAQYSNASKKKPPLPIFLGTVDPLSALYHVRTNELQEGVDVRRPVTDGRNNVTGTVQVIRRETVKVPAGTFETFLIQPQTEGIGGVFQKSKNAKLYLWVTADHRRMPVKVKSKVAVGSFVGELVSVKNPS